MNRKLFFSLLISIFFLEASAQSIKSPKWSVSTDGYDTGWDSPAIGPDGRVYFGATNGKLYAVNPNGSVKWVRKMGKDFGGSSPALTRDGTRFYIGEQASPGRMFCINTSDGSMVWSYTLPKPDYITNTPERGQQIGGGINSTPAISGDGNTIYFGTGNWVECNECKDDVYDDRLIALDVSTESPVMKWALSTIQESGLQNKYRVSFWASPSIASDGSIYIAGFNGFLYHLKDNGTSYDVLHSFNFFPSRAEKAIREDIPPEIWSAVALSEDGTVYISANDGRLWCFNSDLSIKWRHDFEYDGKFFEAFATPIIAPNGYIIQGSEKGYIEAFDPLNGQLIWRYPDVSNPPEEWWRTPTVNDNGTLIVGSEKSGRYFGINSVDGKLLWQTPEIGQETGCFPAIADDGTIYITGGYTGDLFALDGDAPLARTAWPKGMQNNSNNSLQPKESKGLRK